MKTDKLKLSQEAKDLQSSLSGIKGSNRTEADWKKLEAQQKVISIILLSITISFPQEFQSKYSSLSASMKFVEGNLRTKSSELADALDR